MDDSRLLLLLALLVCTVGLPDSNGLLFVFLTGELPDVWYLQELELGTNFLSGLLRQFIEVSIGNNDDVFEIVDQVFALTEYPRKNEQAVVHELVVVIL